MLTNVTDGQTDVKRRHDRSIAKARSGKNRLYRCMTSVAFHCRCQRASRYHHHHHHHDVSSRVKAVLAMLRCCTQFPRDHLPKLKTAAAHDGWRRHPVDLPASVHRRIRAERCSRSAGLGEDERRHRERTGDIAPHHALHCAAAAESNSLPHHAPLAINLPACMSTSSAAAAAS